jgi:hypothetical protein
MSATADPDAWIDVARSLRMELAHVADANVTATSFQTLRREMARGTCVRPSYLTSPWMQGQRNDVAVVTRVVAMRHAGTTEKPQGPTHSAAIAEIDPPLFAGLRMFSRDLVAYFGVSTAAEATGHPSLDTRFLTYAFDLRRVREVLLPRGYPDRLGEGIAQASNSCSLVVKDSSVEALALGASADVARFDGLIDIATSIAREVSQRARWVEHQPLEIQAREAWQKLAATLGLSVDPLRWHIYGAIDGVDVSVTLDGSPPGVSTLFRARFRSPLACSLLLRSGYRDTNILGRAADQGSPGFPELDPLLVLHTAHLPQARALLAEPALRQMIATEARSSNLVLDEREITLGRGGFASTREIKRRLEALVAIVDRLTPGIRAAGPFR